MLSKRRPYLASMTTLGLVLISICIGCSSMQSPRKKHVKPFSLSRIASNLENNPQWETLPLTGEQKQELQHVFDQNFFYIGQGKQCFAFSSEDAEYVLKFFKCYRLQVPRWLKILSFLPILNSYVERQTTRKSCRTYQLFNSCKLAFEELKNETGLLYLHLNKTNELNKKMQLTDKTGRHYIIALDDYQFIVQRRANHIYPVIQKLMEKGRFTEAEKHLHQLLALLIVRHQKGIYDCDPTLVNNSGFVDDRAIHMDIGRFVKNEDLKLPEHSKTEIDNITKELRTWLYNVYPELGHYLDAQITLYSSCVVNMHRH